ncbi:Uncharacterized protein BP5553_03535 [Venustampulla echinocandica]|uniref:Uncharacterized protein n=1 Tax=Venustampulla echinocandica TaxID=2656787 RepID=A0A370TUI4_9HELO|nr:Uncharacterized protein BP5553_03535 [Venustampulla echinocandica]RDL39195.1 Uncharacterized protein BP5553_03535 [Venustampulla echinocandica]
MQTAQSSVGALATRSAACISLAAAVASLRPVDAGGAVVAIVGISRWDAEYMQCTSRSLETPSPQPPPRRHAQVMATPSPRFLHVWRDDGLRSALLAQLDTASICALRLTSSEFCDLTTADLFARTRLTFTPSALTRPSRVEALSRVGPYIKHLTFSMPHTLETFLPPLLNPLNGHEVNFLYTPHTTVASVIQRPKYGCPQLGDLLTQQYPPIFHAATNVPAFINALTHMPNIRHLTISCPDQDPAMRYRRDCVDYALISLRIAIERAPLIRLEKLSLSHIPPSALQYFRHTPGYGCTPSAGRRWKQIRKLNIVMDSWDFLGLRPGLDHLKILDDYIRNFSPNLEKISFGWNGRKGPCPLTLFTDPLFAPPRKTAKLFGEVTSPMSPLPAAPQRPAMNFPKLRYMQVRNATMSAEQVSEFVLKHRHTVKEFDFESVYLINGGTWEDALAPLARISGHDEWLSQQSGSDVSQSQDDLDLFEEPEEVIDTMPGMLPHYDPPVEAETSSVHVKKLKKRVRRRRRKNREHKDQGPEKLVISGPIRISDPVADVLQPTTFNPNVQGVQRNIELEAAQQELADDPERRVSTLKKAREAVLKQLGKEFCKSQDRKDHMKGFWKNTCSPAWKSKAMLGHESQTALVPLMFNRC